MTSETRTVSLGDRSYDIFFDRNVYPAVQKWINKFHSGKSVYVVTDRNVASIYGDDIRRWFAEEPEKLLLLPPGEEHKNLSAVGRIYSFLSEGNAGRDSVVIAFGGGVIGDLAGFAAATFMRGIPFIQIPTTLLSMLDSSVGGKTGFNLPEGKNLIGAFYQPCAAFIDDSFLATLDDRNLRSGLAEAIKSALAGDAKLWEMLAERGSQWKAFSGDDWQEIIRRSVSFKISVVEKDERESHLRKILNLGHTIGHALEQSGGYRRFLHGEAVAAGLAWEAVLGQRLGVTPESVVNDVLSLLFGMGYGLDIPDIPLASIEAAVGMDKKRAALNIDLPLIVQPGKYEIRRVPLEDIRMELAGVRTEIQNRATKRESDRELLHLGEPHEAVRFLESYVAANPKDERAIILLADAYRRAGNVTAAWGAIQEALGRNISDPSILQMAAELGKLLAQAASVEANTQTTFPLENMLVMGEDAYQISVADSAAPVEEESEWQLVEPPVSDSKKKAASPWSEKPVPEAAAIEPEIPASAPSSDGASSVDTDLVQLTKELEESDFTVLPDEEESEWQLFELSAFAPEEETAFLLNEKPVIEEAATTEPEIPVSASFSDDALPIETSLVSPIEIPEEPETQEEAKENIVEEKSDPTLAEASSSAGTITLADLYWEQGEWSAARKVIKQILEEDSGNMRAREWIDLHGEEDPVESALEAFLDFTAKEFGYDLSRYH